MSCGAIRAEQYRNRRCSDILSAGCERMIHSRHRGGTSTDDLKGHAPIAMRESTSYGEMAHLSAVASVAPLYDRPNASVNLPRPESHLEKQACS